MDLNECCHGRDYLSSKETRGSGKRARHDSSQLSSDDWLVVAAKQGGAGRWDGNGRWGHSGREQGDRVGHETLSGERQVEQRQAGGASVSRAAPMGGAAIRSEVAKQVAWHYQVGKALTGRLHVQARRWTGGAGRHLVLDLLSKLTLGRGSDWL
ncbi:hypothetical protein ABZP36_001057 [Zizania latifolia]